MNGVVSILNCTKIVKRCSFVVFLNIAMEFFEIFYAILKCKLNVTHQLFRIQNAARWVFRGTLFENISGI